MQPTPYADVNEIAAGLLGRLNVVLGPNLAGVYLFGSSVVGAFEAGISDIDLLVVTGASLGDGQFADLLEMHAEVARAFPEWSDRIEARYIPAAALKSFRTETSMTAAISPGEPFQWSEAGPERLLNWYEVQENGVPLFGPAANAFFERISEAEFVGGVRAHLVEWPAWLEELPHRTGSQSYAVLTICRGLYGCRFGKQISKTEAGLWAKSELPEWAGLIETALEWRRSGSGRVQSEADEATLQRVSAFVTYASQQVALPSA